MTRGEMCEKLAEDYAQRASNRGMDYKQSYKNYMKRTQKLKPQELFERFSIVTNFPTVIKTNRTEEYIIRGGDDDCEEGVCKL